MRAAAGAVPAETCSAPFPSFDQATRRDGSASRSAPAVNAAELASARPVTPSVSFHHSDRPMSMTPTAHAAHSARPGSSTA